VSVVARTGVLTLVGILALVASVAAESLAILSDQPAADYGQYSPAFSPDSQYLAWVERRGPGNDSYISVLKIGAGSIRRIPEQGRATDFCWGPRGHVIAYVDAHGPPPGRTGTTKLSIVDLDGGQGREMPLNGAAAHYLTWTDEGIQLVILEVDEQGMTTCRLARIDPEAGETEFLSDPIAFPLTPWRWRNMPFAWSPDGSAAALLDVFGPPYLYVWRVGTAGFAADAGVPGMALVPSAASCLAVGPGGEEVFLVGQRGAGWAAAPLWRYRPLQQEAKTIFDLPVGQAPLCIALSPSGDKLALLSSSGGATNGGNDGLTLRVTTLADAAAWAEHNVELGARVRTAPMHGLEHPTMTWSRDCEWLAYSIGGQVRLADIGTQTDLCVVHVKQLALAFLMFASDWDGFPHPEHVAQCQAMDRRFHAVEGADWWTALLEPYVKNSAIMRCPLMAADEGSGYVYPEDLWGKNVAQIQEPTRTILLMDSEPRHDGRRVVAFVDGHVEVIAEEDIPAEEVNKQ